MSDETFFPHPSRRVRVSARGRDVARYGRGTRRKYPDVAHNRVKAGEIDGEKGRKFDLPRAGREWGERFFRLLSSLPDVIPISFHTEHFPERLLQSEARELTLKTLPV